MNIGINTRLLLAGKMDGIGWFTAETAKRIVRSHPEHEFYFFFDRDFDQQFIYSNNVHPVRLSPPSRHPVLWYVFFEHSLRRALKKYNIDLFLSPDGYMSLGTRVPTLTVIHDINFEHSKDYLKPSHQRFMTHFSPQYARYSTRIATVSEFSKSDIAETYHISPDKIDVVYDGAHEEYHPLCADEQQLVRVRHTNGRPFFIFISTILKRKNLATLLTAFDIFKQEDASETKLVVIGHRAWWKDELELAYNSMTHKDDVIFMGRANPEVLAQMLASAMALVYPSFFEGFGIPILEAFHSDTPVITSNCTSMPEVAGDAALLVEPSDATAMAEAMKKVASDQELRKGLIEKGQKRKEAFNWDKTASLLWDSMMTTYKQQQ